jgi:hypothetical protein
MLSKENLTIAVTLMDIIILAHFAVQERTEVE